MFEMTRPDHACRSIMCGQKRLSLKQSGPVPVAATPIGRWKILACQSAIDKRPIEVRTYLRPSPSFKASAK